MSTNDIHARLNTEAEHRAAAARRQIDDAAELRRMVMREDRATMATVIVFASIGLCAALALVYLAVTR